MINGRNENRQQIGGRFNTSLLWDSLYILTAVVIVFLALFFMDENLFVNRPIIYGDAGLPDLNSSLLAGLATPSPWFTSIDILLFHLSSNLFGLIYNEFGLIPILLMPAAMYILLKRLGIAVPARIAGSVLYVMNPILLVWGGWEYGGPMLFLPLIAASVISYRNDGKIIHLLYVAVFLFLMTTLVGFSEIKLVLPVLGALILWQLVENAKKRLGKTIVDILLSAVFFLILSLPLIVYITGAYSTYSTAFSSSTSLYPIERGIVEYVFQSSNLQNSIMALTIYPGSYPQIAGYNGSWSEFAWLSIVVFSIFAAIHYRGKFRGFYISLLLLLVILVVFQYGVYNGTLLFLYRYPFVVIYNYPLFLNVSQMFIYSIFFALAVEYICKLVIKRKQITVKKRHLLSIHSPTLIAIVAIAIILFASLPLLDYSHGNGTLNANPREFEEPSYWNGITVELASYQGYKTLVLPNNYTSLTYLDGAVPYGEAYGLPYNYQAFPTEFPNVTLFSELSKDFANGNISGVTKMLLSQDIGIIVVTNIESSLPISYGQTTINGGGKIFASIINSTGIYSILDKTVNYIIFQRNSEATGFNITPSTLGLYNSFENLSSSSPSIYIVSGKYSHISIPIYLKNFSENNNFIFQQRFFIPRNLSSAINSNFSNIYFAYANGTLLPAWIQSMNSSGALIWVKLASGTNEVFLWIFPYYYNLLSMNGDMGEAPQLSPVYGEYDNGASVFNFYDNFANQTDATTFFNIGTESAYPPNYSINKGLYLGSGAIFTSYQPFSNGTLFGEINYETPNTFGSGGADVAHDVGLTSNISDNGLYILYETYSQYMYVEELPNLTIDNYFTFNHLYNFSLYSYAGYGTVTLGNFSFSSNIYHNNSFYIQLQNQPASGNNGTMYIPYLAYSDTMEMPNYSFGKVIIQQGEYNSKPVDNPGDANVSLRFIAYSINFNQNLSYEWKIGDGAFFGQVVNYTFSAAGTYKVELISMESGEEIKAANFTENVVSPLLATVTSIYDGGHSEYSFKVSVHNGTGSYRYLWYVDGSLVGHDQENLTYIFDESGQYILQIFVMDSGGSIVQVEKYINVSAFKAINNRTNILMVLYNLLTLPFAMLFLTQNFLIRRFYSIRKIVTIRKWR